MFSYHALVSICYAVICSFEVEIRTANIRLNFGFTKFARSAERTNLERYEEDSNSRSKIFPLARMVSSRAQIRDCLKTGSLAAFTGRSNNYFILFMVLTRAVRGIALALQKPSPVTHESNRCLR